MELKQKSGSEIRHFTITSSGLLYGVKSESIEDKTFVPFELLSKKKLIYREFNQVFKSAAAILAVAGGIGALYSLFFSDPGMVRSAFWVVLSAVFYLMYRFFKREYHKVLLRSDKFVYFLKDKPNRADYENFMNTLYQERDSFLKERYYIIDDTSEVDALFTRFKWLRDEEVISGTEYVEICDQLAIDVEEELTDFFSDEELF